MQKEPNTKLRDLPTTYKLGKKLTKVAWSNILNGRLRWYLREGDRCCA